MRGPHPRIIALSFALLTGTTSVFVGIPASAADETEEVRRAKSFFEEGRAQFRAGDFEAAASAFAAGHALVPRSTFLLNMGLCYRQLKQLDRAEDAFRRFVAAAAADDPYLPQARDMLDEIVRQRVPPAVAPVVIAAPPSRLSARPRRTQRVLAWALPVGTVVLTGAILGIVFGVRASGPACDGERFGCFDLR